MPPEGYEENKKKPAFYVSGVSEITFYVTHDKAMKQYEIDSDLKKLTKEDRLEVIMAYINWSIDTKDEKSFKYWSNEYNKLRGEMVNV